ncbi:FAD-dependent monooxygenase [Streptomyces sp. NBC_01264]|uniref:FAD-dependent monooxygenase n=1 Tax=Streptomyces sp. NBC_01264 TaxID=2903804 RepID=UPI00224D67E6|nr:FAD-dependent monooxygenase [Streptomyces sp. NBC_01264]MCX4783739.1 FAD-dependent monooxygenase [Streptomyces sp. NBC_01264]
MSQLGSREDRVVRPDRPDRLDTDVVVVGAGPVGLMLAGELRLGGAEVTVLDRGEAPASRPRPRSSDLHTRTMEILDGRGLLGPLGSPPREMRGHFGRWAASSGADVRRRFELRGLTVTEEHVEAEAVGPAGPVRVRGRYLVGCDGGHSTVRRLTGARFPGRVLFAGDAADRRAPAGGRALDLGLQDAVNLGWKLAAAVRGWAPPGLLDSYDTERREAGRRVLATIRTQPHLLPGGPGGPGTDPPGPGTDPPRTLLGARIPHARLVTPWGPVMTTTAMLRPGRGLLLDLVGNPALRRAAHPWADRVAFVTARPEPGAPPGPLHGTGAVLVRPDGHIVWTAPAGTGAGLPRAMLRWFGAGQPSRPPSGIGD